MTIDINDSKTLSAFLKSVKRMLLARGLPDALRDMRDEPRVDAGLST